MARRKQNASGARNDLPARRAGGATIGYEARLWQMADALRGLMDAAECKHVVLASNQSGEGEISSPRAEKREILLHA